VSLLDPDTAAELRRRYAGAGLPDLGYATVRDFCESVDLMPRVCRVDGDLKNVQRPWTVKAVLARLPPPARLLEIGGGEPVVASPLVQLGYDVTIVDPYDGSGNGPREYEAYVRAYPEVRIVRAVFEPEAPALRGEVFDGVYSVSVLEHVRHERLGPLFKAIGAALRPDGISIHCVDHVLEGAGAEYHEEGLRTILEFQERLRSSDPAAPARAAAALRDVVARLRGDLETFYLSPQGHNLWRGARPYHEFPFRKVVSIQTAATRR
jgi:SAM-dependent methyltransferase